MPVFKCKMCGAVLNVSENASTYTCEYCDSIQTVPQLNGEKKINLFTRANRLRAMCDFDSAAAVYQNLVSEFPNEAEAYWGLCLCKFGIEYVEDPLTGKRVPTCHRTMYESIFDDPDFKSALSKADRQSKDIYEGEASAIDQIQQRILDVVKGEKPYDVFICYKKSDENKNRTRDSVIAQEIYENLSLKGVKVFFAEITLENKLGVDYEPYIFAALQSAKVMLVVATSEINVNGVWVKNEWSRYAHLMQQDKSKTMIPCYEGMEPEDLPAVMKGKQAQDMSKIGAMQDLVRGVMKLVGPRSSGGIVPEREMSLEDDGMVAEMKRHANGEALLSKITSVGHNDHRESWPQGALTSTVDLQKHSVIQFFINLRRPIGVSGPVETGFIIYDSNGNVMLDATEMMHMQPNWDRFSRGWIIKGDDGVFVQPGVYWAIFWYGNSQAMRYRFNVIDSRSKEPIPVVKEPEYIPPQPEVVVTPQVRKEPKISLVIQKLVIIAAFILTAGYIFSNPQVLENQDGVLSVFYLLLGSITHMMAFIKKCADIKNHSKFNRTAVIGILSAWIVSCLVFVIFGMRLGLDTIEDIVLVAGVYSVIIFLGSWISGIIGGKILRWLVKIFT
ncbi:MAG: TIR domain-containing protein [Firmicutes bacterium]|nr:TIR domain-containing protein [Bacillota bacterium]